jgi:hypothetical protein
MKRPLVALGLCATLALAGMPASVGAQDGKRSAEELWKEFPLEPTVSPTPAEPQASPSTRVVRVHESGGLPGEALIALLIASAGIGALATVVAGHRGRLRTVGQAVAEAPAEPSARRFARRRSPAAEQAPAPTPRAAPAPAPAKVKAPERAPADSTASRQAPVRERVSVDRAAAPPPAIHEAGAGFAELPSDWDTCRIKLHNRSIRAHFFAVPYEGGPVIARSPYFTIRRADGEPGLSAPEALRALVDELTAAGWYQTAAGRAPWDLRFTHGAPAPRR